MNSSQNPFHNAYRIRKSSMLIFLFQELQCPSLLARPELLWSTNQTMYMYSTINRLKQSYYDLNHGLSEIVLTMEIGPKLSCVYRRILYSNQLTLPMLTLPVNSTSLLVVTGSNDNNCSELRSRNIIFDNEKKHCAINPCFAHTAEIVVIHAKLRCQYS